MTLRRVFIASALALFPFMTFANDAPLYSCSVKTTRGSVERYDLHADFVEVSEFSAEGIDYKNVNQASVQVFEGAVREGMSAIAEKISIEMFDRETTTDSSADLNPAERYISQVLILPLLLQGEMNAAENANLNVGVGFDVTKVRSATVYLIDEPTHLGQDAIVVGRDADGKVLGSFLGGLQTRACVRNLN